MGALKHLIDLLLMRGQQVEVALCCRRQRFDDIFQGVVVNPMQQVENLDRNLGVCEKLGKNIALCEV